MFWLRNNRIIFNFNYVLLSGSLLEFLCKNSFVKLSHHVWFALHMIQEGYGSEPIY